MYPALLLSTSDIINTNNLQDVLCCQPRTFHLRCPRAFARHRSSVARPLFFMPSRKDVHEGRLRRPRLEAAWSHRSLPGPSWHDLLRSVYRHTVLVGYDLEGICDKFDKHGNRLATREKVSETGWTSFDPRDIGGYDHSGPAGIWTEPTREEKSFDARPVHREPPHHHQPVAQVHGRDVRRHVL